MQRYASISQADICANGELPHRARCPLPCVHAAKALPSVPGEASHGSTTSRTESPRMRRIWLDFALFVSLDLRFIWFSYTFWHHARIESDGNVHVDNFDRRPGIKPSTSSKNSEASGPTYPARGRISSICPSASMYPTSAINPYFGSARTKLDGHVDPCGRERGEIVTSVVALLVRSGTVFAQARQ